MSIGHNGWCRFSAYLGNKWNPLDSHLLAIAQVRNIYYHGPLRTRCAGSSAFEFARVWIPDGVPPSRAPRRSLITSVHPATCLGRRTSSRLVGITDSLVMHVKRPAYWTNNDVQATIAQFFRSKKHKRNPTGEPNSVSLLSHTTLSRYAHPSSSRPSISPYGLLFCAQKPAGIGRHILIPRSAHKPSGGRGLSKGSKLPAPLCQLSGSRVSWGGGNLMAFSDVLNSARSPHFGPLFRSSNAKGHR